MRCPGSGVETRGFLMRFAAFAIPREPCSVGAHADTRQLAFSTTVAEVGEQRQDRRSSRTPRSAGRDRNAPAHLASAAFESSVHSEMGLSVRGKRAVSSSRSRLEAASVVTYMRDPELPWWSRLPKAHMQNYRPSLPLPLRSRSIRLPGDTGRLQPPCIAVTILRLPGLTSSSHRAQARRPLKRSCHRFLRLGCRRRRPHHGRRHGSMG